MSTCEKRHKPNLLEAPTTHEKSNLLPAVKSQRALPRGKEKLSPEVTINSGDCLCRFNHYEPCRVLCFG